jgi:hypothetical protein
MEIAAREDSPSYEKDRLDAIPEESSGEEEVRGLSWLNGWILFLFVIAVYVGISFVANTFLITEEIYYQTYGEQMAADRIRDLLAMQDRYMWISYAIIPLMIGLKITFTTLCLSVGAVLMEYGKMTFSKLFKVAMICESVFILRAIFQYVYVFNFTEVETLQDLSQGVASVSSLFPQNAIPQWAMYALQTMNVFEVFYVLALAGLCAYAFRRDTSTMIVFSATSYGIGLLLWIVAATFFLMQVV